MTTTLIRLSQWITLLFTAVTLWHPVNAQLPHPKDVFGFTPGDDYQLATYEQMLDYYQQLAKNSDRVQLKEIGNSVLGKPLLLLMISSKKNLKKLEKWRNISEQLARAKVDASVAKEMAAEGKAIVWIDGGLHATEVAGAQMTPLLAHRIATEESDEVQKIRENCILLLMPVMNPDGLDIIASWYKQQLKTPFEMTRPPWLYHHYIGHDNNRDWFMNNMPESKAVTQVLYNEWYPQIVYNHHQTGPSWTRIFIPPFADPVNPNIHPGVTTGVNMVGSAMANRFALQKMRGAVSGVIYSMWWNGGMRTVPYFHNMIGILTETSHATASPRFYDPDSIPKSIAARRGSGHPTNGTNIFYPYPWKGGVSDFKQPVAYMMEASMATLNVAADLRQQWLWNIYQMGQDAIQSVKDQTTYAYIIPARQRNHREASNLVNILRLGGIEVHQATSDFKVGDTSYQAGDYIVYAAQAFRPYIVDLLEKQVYPNRRRNGQPETPYDLAGWTLPMQMAVEISMVKEPVEIAGKLLEADAQPMAGQLNGVGSAGYMLSPQSNASILAINQLLQKGVAVSYLAPSSESEEKHAAGSYFIEKNADSEKYMAEIAGPELGLDAAVVASQPQGNWQSMKRAKIGLYKSWVANMDEGWTRWVLQEYAFDVDTLHDADIRNKELSTYQAIILPHQSSRRLLNGHQKGMMPEGFTGGLGLEGTLALKKYVEGGGRLLALDGSSDFLIEQFGLPIENVVKGVSSRQFFIPGSLVRLEVDQQHLLSSGVQESLAGSFVRSRAFEVLELSPEGEGGVATLATPPQAPVEVIARYAGKDILMSGWAMGENKYLGGKAAMVRMPVGQGDVVLFGFRPQFRGQARGTYKLLFNSLLKKAR